MEYEDMMDSLFSVPDQSSSPISKAPDGAPRPSILCVDDEPNILAALRRLLEYHGYAAAAAGSGGAALRILEAQSFDLVISDMRMPEMDGAHFLEQVRLRWPDTMRVMLTGHSDTDSILNAINRGEIYRYITKPWHDNDLLLIVRHTLEHFALQQEKRRLEKLTAKQNDELASLNRGLDILVRERTAALNIANGALQESNRELRSANQALSHANQKLEKNFVTSIKVFTNLLDMRGRQLTGQSRRVADLAWDIALKMGLGEQVAYEVMVAGLLHGIGKIGFPDALLSKPLQQMSDDEAALYRQHPALGQRALMPLPDLQNVALMVRGQHERYGGGGFPDGSAGSQIPLGARILAVACDFIQLQTGAISARPLRAKEAESQIQHGRGKTYDPNVADAFAEVMGGVRRADAQEIAVPVANLVPGMVLARDLVGPDGMLLLTAEQAIDHGIISRITELMKTGTWSATIYVKGAAEPR